MRTGGMSGLHRKGETNGAGGSPQRDPPAPFIPVSYPAPPARNATQASLIRSA
ncbi:hypothetical protein EV382_5573 [Micromonospora violae]|uniref:Uncharacterized protein n=1 Tax=Micromonospora violae TaxID=1278207 RepID=A0A4Q7UL10_9ACTN|nr:hypothetical protein EV382_5573 [Micromonospora violae]